MLGKLRHDCQNSERLSIGADVWFGLGRFAAPVGCDRSAQVTADSVSFARLRLLSGFEALGS
jgi:hypothetical protein